MRCLSCEYDLRNLTRSGAKHRCPECGRVFDPSDSKTFDSDTFALTNPRHVIGAALGLIGLALLLGLFFQLASGVHAVYHSFGTVEAVFTGVLLFGGAAVVCWIMWWLWKRL